MGEQIIKALNAAGIHTFSQLGGILTTGGGQPPVGITVTGPDSEPPFVEALALGLKNGGLAVSEVSIKCESVSIWVGIKPVE